MTLRRIVGNGLLAGGNLLRSLRRRGLACIVVRLEGSYREVPAPRPRLPFPMGMLVRFSTQATLADMRTVVQTIGADARVECVVLLIDSLRAGLGSIHSLRSLVTDLRGMGKRVVGWLPSGGILEYYLASACDEVVLPESGRLTAIGLRAEVMFLKDALARLGVEADLESIAEYKVSPDTFRRASMSEPHRHMLDALLGSLYEHIVESIADGRGLSPDSVRDLLDDMPMGAAKAVEVGLADAALYEDELPAYVSGKEGVDHQAERPLAPLTSWRQASRWLRRPLRPAFRQAVGVVSIEGVIVTGRSHRSPVPLPLPFVQAQAGSDAVIEALRSAEANPRIAAVILSVETPGGSALASDLIWREVRRVRQRKPVVALLGGQATSGGYYVAVGANRIVARPTSITGSIGVWGGKFVVGGLYNKLSVGIDTVRRGAMADLYAETAPFDGEQRARIQQGLGETYARFLRVVAEGRAMEEATVAEVARGRVWTGAQASEIGLVDELGDFRTALELAKELTGIASDREVPVVGLYGRRREQPPLPYLGEQAHWQRVLGSLSALAREGVWTMSPWVLRVEG